MMHKHTQQEQHTVHIFVTFGQKPPIKLEFTMSGATGLEIKQRAGATTADGLYHRVDGRVVEVRDDEVVELRNGMQFTIVPNGRVS